MNDDNAPAAVAAIMLILGAIVACGLFAAMPTQIAVEKMDGDQVHDLVNRALFSLPMCAFGLGAAVFFAAGSFALYRWFIKRGARSAPADTYRPPRVAPYRSRQITRGDAPYLLIVQRPARQQQYVEEDIDSIDPPW